MPILGILIVGLQIFFAVHAIRNRKDGIWLWIIILAPGIGCAIYFLTQFAPDAANSPTANRAKNTLIRAVDPKRELRKRMAVLEGANTTENRIALADECIEAGIYPEAIKLLQESLVGVHDSDPSVLERLAYAQFHNDQAADAQKTLDLLITNNPAYQSADGHLLYARTLEAQEKHTEAIAEYDILRTTYPGEEARVRYAQLLKKLGKTALADELFQEALDRAKRAPKHYRRNEKVWLQIAERG